MSSVSVYSSCAVYYKNIFVVAAANIAVTAGDVTAIFDINVVDAVTYIFIIITIIVIIIIISFFVINFCLIYMKDEFKHLVWMLVLYKKKKSIVKNCIRRNKCFLF